METIGVHLGLDRTPDEAASDLGARCAQVFVADPQDWKAVPDPAWLERLAASTVPVYVHAPYPINLASGNNRIRIPSRKLLDQTLDAAARARAAAVIVHGGHVTADDDPAEGVARWRKALERIDSEVPLLLENTAGGDHAMARHFDALARLWDGIGDFGIGFCLDTCHAHAAGEPFDGLVDRVRAITGRIDLVHCNDSRDPFGSGRDRHTNIGKGEIGGDAIAAVIRDAGSPAILETPPDGQAADLALLRSLIGNPA
jgi:deoxyribonuclease IV